MSRIQELEKIIWKARKDYYSGTATISDKQYDTYVDELYSLDPKNPAVIGIGHEPVSNWEKYTHKVDMGSLNKAQTAEEYTKWHDEYIGADDEVLVTLKLDGLSLSLIYENGKLVAAATRGNGAVGELITQNAAKMIGIPLLLKEKIDITVRGEIVLSKTNHAKHFSSYSNPRNAASGVSRRYDGEGSEFLSFLAYNLVTDSDEIKTHSESFDKLKEYGFTTPFYSILKTKKEVLSFKESWATLFREKYEIDLDGLVAHNNSLAKCEAAGIVNNRPKASIAIKFDSVSKEATIVDIICQVGNSGRITPVAVFSPKVQLAGAEIERASLHNFGNIKSLGIDIGAKVLVCRSNDVIPFVEEVTSSTGTIYQTPLYCPACNKLTVETGEYVQCSNYACSSQVAGRIKNWIKELNILEWGNTLIERIVETKLVNTIADLYRLDVAKLAAVDRMGIKSATKCISLLHAYKDIPLEIFIGGLSIPTIGSSTIKLLMQAGCATIDDLYKWSVVDMQLINGLGPTKAQNLKDGLTINKALIDELLELGLKIKAPQKGVLSNKSICFTGSMVNKRPVLEKMASDAGGLVKSSVSKDLTYLVMSDVNSQSSKAVSARKQNIKIISEEDFLEMMKL